MRNSQKLHAAILLPCLLTGGSEVATLATARALQQLDFVVDVIVYFDEVDPMMLDSFSQAGISVHRLGIHRDGGAIAPVQLVLLLTRLLIRKRYSLIWLQYMTPTLLPLLVARCFTRHLVAAVHVAAGHYNPRGIHRIRWLARYWCTRFVCVSETVAKGVFGSDWLSGVYAKRVVVIPNSLDTSETEAAVPRCWRDELNWPQDRLIIGFCGRLAVIKGADILIDAAAMLVQQWHDIGVVLVGDGEERGQLQALVTQAGIEKRVYVAGRVPREGIYSAIKGFDIAVVPSREEGFGLSALEAMACGVPVVASHVDALSEIINDGVTGLLFRTNDPNDLSSVITRLIGNHQLSQNLKHQALHHVHQHYNSAQFRSRIADLVASTGLDARSV